MTDDEWDACFYVFKGPNWPVDNFGACIHIVIAEMLQEGYVFSGLDSAGEKSCQVPSGNAAKFVAAMGLGSNDVDFLAILENGRRFIQKHLPARVTETDDYWAQMVADAKASRGAAGKAR